MSRQVIATAAVALFQDNLPVSKLTRVVGVAERSGDFVPGRSWRPDGRIAGAFASVILALAGCSNEPTRDVRYYLEHPTDRATKLAECKNNPGKSGLEPNCKNAMEAENQASFKGDGMPTIK